MPAKQHAKAENLAAVSDEATLAELGIMAAGPLIARAVDVLGVIASHVWCWQVQYCLA